jgi:hypothetical protein
MALNNIEEIAGVTYPSTKLASTEAKTNKQTSKHKYIYLMQGGVNIITN